jgi:PAS domain S-box-containing protein
MLKKLLSPPIFDDEDQTLEARLLHTILLALMGVTLFTFIMPLLVTDSVLSPPVLYLVLVAGLGVLAGLMALMRRGYIQWASRILVGLFWCIITVLAAASGGPRAPAYFGYPVVVTLAGLLLGGRASAFVTFISALAGLGMLSTEQRGLLPEIAMTPGLGVWYSATAYLIILALLQYLVTQAMRNAVQRARASEAQYRMLIEESPDGITIMDSGFRILQVNPRASELLGYPLVELLGRQAELLIAPDDLEQLPLPTPEEWQSGQAIRRERTMVRRDGQRVAVSGSLKRLPDGRLHYIFQDITERQKAEEEIHRLNADLEQRVAERTDALAREQRLNEIARIISGALNLETLFPNVVRLAAELVGAQSGSLALIAPDGETIIYPHLFNIPEGLSRAPTPRGTGLSWQIVESRAPLVLDEYTAHARAMPGWATAGFHAFIGVPVIAGDACLGALGLFSTEPDKRFNARDVALVEAIGRQAGIAIQNAQLFEAEQRRADLLTALHETGLDLSAELDLTILLQTIMERAMHLVGAEMGGLYVMRPESDSLERVANLPYEDTPSLVRFGEGLVGRVAASGQPVIVPDYLQWPGAIPDLIDPPRAVLGVPIQWREQALGVLSVCDMHANHFQPKDIDTVQLFAAQAAVAIKNAQLFAATRRQLDELTVLHTVGLIAAQAVTEDQLIERTTAVIGETLYSDIFGVMLVDWAAQVLRPHRTMRGISDEARRAAPTLALGQGITGRVVLERQPRRVADVTREPDYFMVASTIRSELCVPLKVGELVIGVIDVESVQPDAFSESDERLLATVAGQLATAIARLRLMEELEERVRRRTEELSAANAALARAARMKDEFLASMSHELRTPLTGILAFSQAMQKLVYGSLTEKQLKALRSIEDSGKHLLELINDILDLSKIEAGKLELEPGLVSAEEICQASLRLIKEMAQTKRQDVTYSLRPPDLRLVADHRRVKQMLVNLLSNAVKFAPEGGALGLEVEGDSRQKVVRFSVWDKGIGIAAADFPKLFQPFVQLDSSLSRQYPGTGLGLALVRRMAEMHGGGVEVKSNGVPGEGSRFTVTLPWDQPAEPDPGESLAPRVGTLRLLPLRQALTVEDSEVTAEQLTRYLKELGVANVVLPRAAGAVQTAAEIQPGVILLDIFLPDQSGWDLLTQLKADPRTKDIPVVIVSVIEDRARAAALGAAEYLVKPVALTDLHVALTRLAAQTRVTPAHPALVVSLGSRSPAQPRLLLAEDNEVSISVLTDFLQDEGYEMSVARNGREAVAQAGEVLPDLILMDIQMPGMDGLEATRLLRQESRFARTPIIALTALAMPGDRERCLVAGASEYLAKPVNLEELVELIKKLLNGD